MKKMLFASVLTLLVSVTFAQRKVEQTFDVDNARKIKLDLRFAESIKLMQWSKNEVKVSAEVNIDEGAGNDAYNLKTDRKEDTYVIGDDYGDYFEKKRKERYNNTRIEITYVIYVPENSDLTVKSISGNLFAESFEGRLETDLVSGNVELKRYEGGLKLKTVSGSLDVAIAKADIDARTVTGTIYSDLDISIRNKGRRGFDSHIQGSVNSGTDLVKLETVSGNIYMRRK